MIIKIKSFRFSMRRIIASRLVESKQQIPHFYLVAECTLNNLLQLRKQINNSLESKITINDFIVKASGLAIKKSASDALFLAG